jgi:hypothetical protein
LWKRIEPNDIFVRTDFAGRAFDASSSRPTWP